MNQAPRPLVTAQRLLRLSLWLRLTVAWFVAQVLALTAPNIAARYLAHHARTARLLLVSRAVKAVAFRRGVIGANMRRLTCRGVAGAKLRRALRTGTITERASAICDALAAPERWIAYIAKRLQRGFSKLKRLPAPRRETVRIAHGAPRMADAINSS